MITYSNPQRSERGLLTVIANFFEFNFFNMIYMGRVFILVLVCVLFWDITYGLQINILIVGKILNYDNTLVLEDMSELGELRLVSRDQVAIPDSAGNFRIEYIIEEPNYFRIGRNILFMQPKDTLD